jgi:hypothetical protein
MAKIFWSVEKNNQLEAHADREICFKDIVAAIENDGLIDDVFHRNAQKNPGPRVLAVLCNGYIYGVPYVVQDDGSFFLKTAFPSRLLKKRYMAGEGDDTGT